MFTILLGVLCYGEYISLSEGLGYSLALVGFAGYNAAKAGYWDKIDISALKPSLLSSPSSSSPDREGTSSTRDRAGGSSSKNGRERHEIGLLIGDGSSAALSDQEMGLRGLGMSSMSSDADSEQEQHQALLGLGGKN